MAICSSTVMPPLRSEYRRPEGCSCLSGAKSWLLVFMCLMAVGVLDPTAMPARRLWYDELARLRRQIDKCRRIIRRQRS